jgi:hypothetical protein
LLLYILILSSLHLSEQLYCQNSSSVRTAVLSEELYCQKSCTVRTAVVSEELYCQNSCTVRTVVLSEELYCQNSCSVRTAVVSEQLYCQNSCSVRTPVVSEQLYCQNSCTVRAALCRPHTNGLNWVLLPVIFYAANEKAFFSKLHLSLPTSIIVLFDSTVSNLLWSIHLLRSFTSFPSMQLLLFLFSRIKTVSSKSFNI